MRRTSARKLAALGLGLATVAALAISIPALATSRGGETSRVAQGTVTNVTVGLSSNLANHLAKYTVNFKTTAGGALVAGDTITLRLPGGTIPGSFCGDVAAFAGNVTVNGVATSVSSIIFCLQVRVTVPAAIGGNTNVTVVLGSSSNVIRNPGAGTYSMKVRTTKDFTDANSAPYVIVRQHVPVASNLSPTTNEDTAKVITLSATDSDGDALTFAIVSGSGPAHGTLGSIGAVSCGVVLNTCTADIMYTPYGDYKGSDSFKYKANDSIAKSVAAMVSITVTAVNDPPVAVDDAATVAQDSGANPINVLANDSDVDVDLLTITTPSPAATSGTVACSASSCTYTPNALFNGTDAFTYSISDGHGGTASATAVIEVTPPGGGGGPGAANFTLCARTGSLTMPDLVAVPTWQFALGSCSLGLAGSLPGPQLEVNVGDQVTITLDNSLGQNVALSLPGQSLVPDETGAAPGGQKAYTFTADRPGTYLYEAAGARQQAMGLYGALIVRPATAGRAYDSPVSSYNVEAVLVLSEIDPAFNAAPNSFDLLTFAPKYWLINGKAYPATPTISAPAGQKVLLRYLNAGSVHLTMGLLGMRQIVIGRDSDPVRYPYNVVAETIPAGSTADMIATIPAAAASGARFPLYNRQLNLNNAGAFPGGILTFLTVP